MDVEEIGKEIVDSAIKVHRELGPGLLKSAYQHCLMFELQRRGIPVDHEVPLPILYDGNRIDVGYRIDLVVANLVIVENKTVDQLLPIHEAQILTYLKLGGFQLGYLINWNVKLIKYGIKRVVHNISEPRWRSEHRR